MKRLSLALVSLLSACAAAPEAPEHYGSTAQASTCHFDCGDEIPMQGEHLLGANLDAFGDLTKPGSPMFSVGLNGHVDGDTTTSVHVEVLDGDVGLQISTGGLAAVPFGQSSSAVLPAMAPHTGELRITWGMPSETAMIQNVLRTANFYNVEWRADPNDPASPYEPMCEPGEYAVPLYGDYNVSRHHQDAPDRITFACLSGVAAKCIMWHYLPGKVWSLEPASPWQVHQACTRMANYDLCRTGVPHTREGTPINMFDTVGVRQAPPETFFGIPRWPPPHDRMYFEAAWRGDKPDFPNKGMPQVPVCLSKLRWSTLPPDPTNPFCPSGDLPDPRNDTKVETCDEEVGVTGYYYPYGGEVKHAFDTFLAAHTDTVLFSVSRYNELAMMPWSDGTDKVTTIDGYVDADSSQMKHPYTTSYDPDPLDVQGMLLRSPYGAITEDLGSGGDYKKAFLWRLNGDRVVAPDGISDLASYTKDMIEGYVYTSSYAQGREDMVKLYLYKQTLVGPLLPKYTTSTHTTLSGYQRSGVVGYLRMVTPRE